MINTPHQQGEAAFDQSRPTSACEYPGGSCRQREWVGGWMRQQALARAIKTDIGQ